MCVERRSGHAEYRRSCRWRKCARISDAIKDVDALSVRICPRKGEKDVTVMTGSTGVMSSQGDGVGGADINLTATEGPAADGRKTVLLSPRRCLHDLWGQQAG